MATSTCIFSTFYPFPAMFYLAYNADAHDAAFDTIFVIMTPTLLFPPKFLPYLSLTIK